MYLMFKKSFCLQLKKYIYMKLKPNTTKTSSRLLHKETSKLEMNAFA